MSKIYKLETTFNFIFYAKVEEDENEITVHIGTLQKPNCMYFIIYRDNNTATLQNLDYYPECTANMPLPKSTGTRNMVKTAFVFIIQKFKWIKYIEFSDNSQFKCSGFSVNTANMSFLIHNKTWYEKHYNARPNFEGYEHLKELMKHKPNIRFYKIWRDYLNKNGNSIFAKDYDYYKDLYHNSKSYTHFFKQIYNQENCGPFISFCNHINIFKMFKTSAISNLYMTTWFVDKEIIENYSITLTVSKLKKNDLPRVKWDRQNGGTPRANYYNPPYVY